MDIVRGVAGQGLFHSIASLGVRPTENGWRHPLAVGVNQESGPDRENWPLLSKPVRNRMLIALLRPLAWDGPTRVRDQIVSRGVALCFSVSARKMPGCAAVK